MYYFKIYSYYWNVVWAHDPHRQLLAYSKFVKNVLFLENSHVESCSPLWPQCVSDESPMSHFSESRKIILCHLGDREAMLLKQQSFQFTTDRWGIISVRKVSKLCYLHNSFPGSTWCLTKSLPNSTRQWGLGRLERSLGDMEACIIVWAEKADIHLVQREWNGALTEKRCN